MSRGLPPAWNTYWLIGSLLNVFQCLSISNKDEFMLFIHPCAFTLQILVIIFSQSKPSITDSWSFVTKH